MKQASPMLPGNSVSRQPRPRLISSISGPLPRIFATRLPGTA